MNKLTKDKLDTIFKDGKNLTNKPIFITFKADWWGPCKMFGQVLDKAITDYNDEIDFYKVDIEESPELAVIFNARSLPTTAMIRKDNSVELSVGGMDEGQLKYWLGGLISN